MADRPSDGISRRDVLRTGTLLVTGALAQGAAPPAARAQEVAPGGAPATAGGVRRRVLGRTGLSVSEIGFGGYSIDDPSVLDLAIDMGINYVDTSDDYRGGRSEEVIGEVMRRRRDAVVLATKFHPWARTRKDQMLADLEGSLRRLKTDHVDVIQVHQVGRASGGESIERITNPDLFEAFEIARRQGKARFLGVTGHDGDLMDVMTHAIDSGRFDVILCRYNFMDYPQQVEVLARARAKGVGVTVMKTLAGAKASNVRPMREAGQTFNQAALRWVLSNLDVSVAVISMSSVDQVREYAAASGSGLTPQDRGMLEDYRRLFDRECCRMCNRCEPACPYGLPIADILRYSMYFHEYHQERDAMERYARIPPGRRADHCLTCDAPCERLCDYRVTIKPLMTRAHRALQPIGDPT